MSQFFWKKSLIVTVVPPVPPEAVGVKTLGDIEFMSVKEFQLKTRRDEGTATAVGDLTTLTANVGKDMYLASAKVNVRWSSTNNSPIQFVIDLLANGVIIGSFNSAHLSSIQAGGVRASDLNSQYEFKANIGQKVLAGEIINLNISVIGSAALVIEGQLLCYEEDTGTSPQITGSGGTSGGGGVGDIGFLAVKDFENKLRTNDGVIVTTIGVGATLTANVGKDMYLAKAQAEVSFTTSVTVNNGPVVLELRFNGIVIDTKRVNPILQVGEGTDSTYLVDFEVGIGKMVAAGQVIDINVLTNTGNQSTITSSLEVWEEDTGDSPGGTGGGSGGGSLRFGESETIFPSAQRAVNSVVTQEFDNTGALYLVVIQDGRIVDNSSRTNQGVPVTWSVQAQTQMIDNDITNGIETNPNSTTSEAKHDWGSIAVRTVTVVGNVRTISNNPANSIVLAMEFSDDDIVYANSQDIESTGGIVNSKDFNNTLAAQSFRYTRVYARVQANSTRATVDELYDKATTGGATNLTFEVFDAERGDWKPLDLTTPIDEVRPIDTGAQFNVISQIGEGQDNRLIMPTATQSAMNLIRAVLTTTDDGLSDTSVVFLKTNTVV